MWAEDGKFCQRSEGHGPQKKKKKKETWQQPACVFISSKGNRSNDTGADDSEGKIQRELHTAARDKKVHRVSELTAESNVKGLESSQSESSYNCVTEKQHKCLGQ